MRPRLPHIDARGHVQHVVFCVRGAHDPHDDDLDADLRLGRSEGGRLLVGAAAACMQDHLVDGQGAAYRLIAWCVMPNHVHALAATFAPLPAIVRGWKGRSAVAINRALGRSGPLWQPNYFDRYMRDEEQIGRTLHYIENNPVVAGLCERPEAWPFGSAFFRVANSEGTG